MTPAPDGRCIVCDSGYTRRRPAFCQDHVVLWMQSEEQRRYRETRKATERAVILEAFVSRIHGAGDCE